MNRSYRSILLVLLLGALVGLGVWWWQTQYGVRRYVLSDVSREQFIELTARPEQSGSVYALELTFSGRISEEVMLEIGFAGNPGYIRKRIKPGTVQTTFHREWYHDHCLIHFRPPENATGNLEISYQFIHLS